MAEAIKYIYLILVRRNCEKAKKFEFDKKKSFVMFFLFFSYYSIKRHDSKNLFEVEDENPFDLDEF